MARKRKEETQELLTGGVQGWRDQFGVDARNAPVQEDTAKDTASAGQFRRKTYLMTDELIERIKEQAQRQGVGINEMHRYLVTVALDAIDSGQHKIAIQVEQKRTLGV